MTTPTPTAAEIGHIRAQAYRARTMWPGPIGDLIADELLWAIGDGIFLLKLGATQARQLADHVEREWRKQHPGAA